MCRNIKPLFNFDPPATDTEIQDAALQFVRKLSGMQKPSTENEVAFNEAIKEITKTTEHLFHHLQTKSHPKNREEEALKRKIRSEKRFGQ